MAGQRRGEPARDSYGRARRRLAFLALTFAVACQTQTRFPTGLGGAGGGGGGGSGSSVINGTWRRTLVVTTPTDVVTSETTWIFSPGGGCQRTVVSNSVLQDVPVTQVSPCSFTVSGGQVTIQFAGTTGSVSFSVAVSGGSLFLNGVAFSRIG